MKTKTRITKIRGILLGALTGLIAATALMSVNPARAYGSHALELFPTFVGR